MSSLECFLPTSGSRERSCCVTRASRCRRQASAVAVAASHVQGAAAARPPQRYYTPSSGLRSPIAPVTYSKQQTLPSVEVSRLMVHSRGGRQQTHTEQTATGTGRGGSATCGGGAAGGSSSSSPSSINASPSPSGGGSATCGGGAAGGSSSSSPLSINTSSSSSGGGSAACGGGVAGAVRRHRHRRR